jgi:hypothetical protein
MIKSASKSLFGCMLLLFLVSLASSGWAASRQPGEKDLFLKTTAFGDFRKAKRIAKEERASLQVWPPYREYLDRLPPEARNRLSQGRESLELGYDDLWVAEKPDYLRFGLAKEHNGEPYLVKLYWQGDHIQALTVAKYFTGDPVSLKPLPKPDYKLVLILGRDQLLPEAQQEAAGEGAFQALRPFEHLREAQKALAEGNPDDQDPRKRTYGRLADARKHLAAITRDAAEYEAAQKLLKEVTRREKDAQKSGEVVQQATREEMIKRREALAEAMDQDFLRKGMDVKIKLGGSDKTAITLESVLFNRPLVFALIDKTDFLPNLKDAGFHAVVFTNQQIKFTWEINLDIL